jgi:cell division transport system permease protein
MQIIHIFTELGTGLRRNVSMTLSLVVTTFVSLALVGFGLLVNEQAEATEEYFNGRSTLLVLLCSETSSGGTCVNGEVTREQREAVEAALEENPQVDSYTYETAEEQYEPDRGRPARLRGSRTGELLRGVHGDPVRPEPGRRHL